MPKQSHHTLQESQGRVSVDIVATFNATHRTSFLLLVNCRLLAFGDLATAAALGVFVGFCSAFFIIFVITLLFLLKRRGLRLIHLHNSVGWASRRLLRHLTICCGHVLRMVAWLRLVSLLWGHIYGGLARARVRRLHCTGLGSHWLHLVSICIWLPVLCRHLISEDISLLSPCYREPFVKRHEKNQPRSGVSLE